MLSKPFHFGVLANFFLILISTAALGDVLSPATRTAGKLTVEVAESIALRQITSEAAAIRALGGAPHASSLWGLIKSLEAQGGLATQASQWTEFRRMVESQDMTETSVLAWLRHHVDTRTPLAGRTMAMFVGSRQGNPIAVERPGAQETPEETFQKYIPQSPLTQQLKEALLATAGRSAQLRIQVIGRILQAAKKTPEVCSIQAKSYCAAAAPEAVLLWAAENFDQAGELAQQFIVEVLAGFPHEAESFVGRGEVTLQGLIAALKMGKNRPQNLNSCLFRGSPSLN